MDNNDHYPANIIRNKMKMFNNLEQSAQYYVQTAIEKEKNLTEDATQNLIKQDLNGKK